MATTSFTALRRIAGVAFTLLLFCLCLSMEAQGQGASPLVTASVATGLDHPAGWGTILQTAVDTQGDWLLVDWSKGGLYMIPAHGGPAVTLIPQPALGGYQNPGIAIDSENTLYLEGNWSNCLLRFPYDPAIKTWPGLSTFDNNNPTSNCPAPYNWAQYGVISWNWGFQPWGLAVDQSNNVWIANQVSGNFAFYLPLNGSGASATPGTPVQLVNSMNKRASSAAVDPWGNFYFTEQLGDGPKYPGVFMVPAGQSGIADETGLTRVDPNLPKVIGVVADPEGNLYVSDNSANDKPDNDAGGTYLVPNVAGTPDPSQAIRLTKSVGQGAGAVDWARHILYIPTSTTQSNNKADVAAIYFGAVEAGSSAVGKAASAPITVAYTFHGVVSDPNADGLVTPAKFAIVESGASAPDFALTGGTCALGEGKKPGETCSEIVTFIPSAVGSVSAKLLMLDDKNNILATTLLHGTGLGANIQAAPAQESSIGQKLSTPSQIATDTMGNIYVADPGLKQVLMYAAGSAAPVSIGTGLTSPTGVAVDGVGDVFIADSTDGSVYEVPFTPSGLNAAGQITLASKLGANLRLAIDGQGSLYVADPANARVVRLGNLGASGPGILGQTEMFLTAGFTAPSSVAVDPSNNLYVIDGANLFELAGGRGTPTVLLNNLSGAVGLAVDPSGAVYLAANGGTQRIPVVNGAADTANATAIAAGVTNLAGVALDKAGNVYLLDVTAENVHVATINGVLDFGTLQTRTSTATQTVTITNTGNGPLSVTGYTSTNALDYTASDVNCISGSPIAPGGTCQFSITMNPGPGEEGPLAGQIGLTSNAGNVAIVNTNGIGAALDKSVSTISVDGSAEAVNAPATVTVKAASGSDVPTGQVTISFTTTTGSTGKVTQTLTNGSTSVTLAPAAAGNQKFIVAYQGDREFGRSTGNSTATVAKSASTMAMPTDFPPFLPYVLQDNGSTPYDGSVQYWQYALVVTVNAAAGQPTGTVTFNDDSSTTGYKGIACPEKGGGLQTVGASGKASFPTQCLPMPQNVTYTPMVSTHTVTPVYSGDANFIGFTGQPTTFIVVRTPAVQLVADHTSLSVPSGGSATANVTLTSVLGYGYAGKNGLLNNYDFPVALGCDNLPPHAQCTFTYPNPAPAIWNALNSVYMPCTGSTAAADDCATGHATITITTNVPVGTTSSQVANPTSLTLAAMFGFGMIGLFFRRRVGTIGRMSLMICLSVLGGALAISLTACSTTNLTPASILTTPAGTYKVTVTAQQVGQQCISGVGGNTTCTTAAGQPGRSVFGSNNQVSLPYTIDVTVQ